MSRLLRKARQLLATNTVKLKRNIAQNKHIYTSTAVVPLWVSFRSVFERFSAILSEFF
jgi:hypothetical protein